MKLMQLFQRLQDPITTRSLAARQSRGLAIATLSQIHHLPPACARHIRIIIRAEQHPELHIIVDTPDSLLLCQKNGVLDVHKYIWSSVIISIWPAYFRATTS
ncbi:hypothetical protein VUR80DRAFT_8630 [Thermomyces stellatus]